MALMFTQKSSVDYRRVPPFERILPRECAELVFAGEDGSVLVPIIDGRTREGHAGTWQRLKQTWDSNGYWHVSLKIANGTGLSVDQFDVQRIVTLAWHGEPIAERKFVRHLLPPIHNNCSDNLAWGSRAEQQNDIIINKNRKNLYDQLLAKCQIVVVKSGRDWIATIIDENGKALSSNRPSGNGRPRENPANEVKRVVDMFFADLDDPHKQMTRLEKSSQEFARNATESGPWLPHNAESTEPSKQIEWQGATFYAQFRLNIPWLKISRET